MDKPCRDTRRPKQHVVDVIAHVRSCLVGKAAWDALPTQRPQDSVDRKSRFDDPRSSRIDLPTESPFSGVVAFLCVIHIESDGFDGDLRSSRAQSECDYGMRTVTSKQFSKLPLRIPIGRAKDGTNQLDPRNLFHMAHRPSGRIEPLASEGGKTRKQKSTTHAMGRTPFYPPPSTTSTSSFHRSPSRRKTMFSVVFTG